jgi:hypothetical protein
MPDKINILTMSALCEEKLGYSAHLQADLTEVLSTYRRLEVLANPPGTVPERKQSTLAARHCLLLIDS